MVSKKVKIAAISVASVIGVFILVIVGYLLYVIIQYDRIEDNLALDIENNQSQTLDIGDSLSVITYNIGFGAYDPEYTFFLDAGVMKDGKKVTGKLGKARNKDAVVKNTAGAIATLKSNPTDFVMVQEADTDSSRSYRVNQVEQIKKELGSDYAATYGVNFHSAYLMFPLNDPHGQSNAGLVTLSKYGLSSSVRRSYPVSNGFDKFLDLDRCFVVNRVPVGDSGKELVMVNSHMSAYDKGGTIRQKQLEMLNSFMADEYAKGNYVVIGGDFNHDIADSGELFPSEQEYPAWVFKLSEEDIDPNYSFAAATNAPTCRAAEMPYTKGVNFTIVVDGYIVSDNIRVDNVTNIDTDFAYSDHNPAKMVFTLL